jgi:ribonuclease D
MPAPELLERPSRDEIALLPPFGGLPLERIELLRTEAQFEDARRAIEFESCAGFDTESKPTFTSDAVRNGPHVIQFALADRAYIVQVGAAHSGAFLKAVIESAHILKVGFGLNSDREPLQKKLGLNLAGAVDLAQVVRRLGYKNALGAKAAVAVVLQQRLQKSKSVTTSNWASPNLSPKQLLYAANDAYAALMVYRAMEAAHD